MHIKQLSKYHFFSRPNRLGNTSNILLINNNDDNFKILFRFIKCQAYKIKLQNNKLKSNFNNKRYKTQ